jgi:hypothetical protein
LKRCLEQQVSGGPSKLKKLPSYVGSMVLEMPIDASEATLVLKPIPGMLANPFSSSALLVSSSTSGEMNQIGAKSDAQTREQTQQKEAKSDG